MPSRATGKKQSLIGHCNKKNMRGLRERKQANSGAIGGSTVHPALFLYCNGFWLTMDVGLFISEGRCVRAWIDSFLVCLCRERLIANAMDGMDRMRFRL